MILKNIINIKRKLIILISILFCFLLIFYFFNNTFFKSKKIKNDLNNPISIFFASNEKYVVYLITAMTSILYNTDSFINFYVIDGGITNESKNILMDLNKKFKNFSLEFIKVDINDIFNGFKKNETFRTFDIYSRFLIPELKPNIDRALYLDADVIVFGDISELYNQDIGDYALGAVHEVHSSSDFKIKNIDEKHKYFNSGVLLINAKKWREEGIIKKLFDIEKKYSKELVYPDQDVLNKAFENNYKVLNYKYNATHGVNIKREDFDVNKDKILVRHFISKSKACDIKYSIYGYYIRENIKDFCFYAKMTPFYSDIQSCIEGEKIDNLKNALIYKFKIFYRKHLKIIYFLIGFFVVFVSVCLSVFLFKILLKNKKTEV